MSIVLGWILKLHFSDALLHFLENVNYHGESFSNLNDAFTFSAK